MQSRVFSKQQEASAAIQTTRSEEERILAARPTLEKAENDYKRTRQLATINAAILEQIEDGETNLKIAAAYSGRTAGRYKNRCFP